MNMDAQAAAPDPIQDPDTAAKTPPFPPETTQAAAPPRPSRDRPSPRTGPIVWGALILAFCGYVLQRTLNPGQIDAMVWVTSTVIGLGILLLAVGVAVLIRNRRSR